ncbi:MAG: carboxypeptidase regulatory-like domain-containing protein [Planctomycetes bacterium]|nr:carboxypeptidase regulatory-like domain-containing protein [Planctomycetota bacterium]
MLLLSLVLLGQDPFPQPDTDPEGTVVDESGAPIAGADVALLGEFSDQGFGLAMAQILARNPLPATRTDRDGHFVLPLTPEQRSLGAWSGNGDGMVWLLVTMPGHLTWQEPLTTGLRGYVGSRVVLPKITAAGPFAAMPWPPTIMMSADVHTDLIEPAQRLRERSLSRAPLRPLPPSRRGDRSAVVRVQDEHGAPIAGARLQFSCAAFASACVAERGLLTDAQGTVRLDGLVHPLTPTDVCVVADGYAYGIPVGCTRAAGDRAETLTWTCAATPRHRCRTLGPDGTVEPFAVVMAHFGARNRACFLVSDACGRLWLDGHPGSDQLFRHPLRAAPTEDADAGIWQLPVWSCVQVLVQLDACKAMTIQWQGGGASGTVHGSAVAPADTWLLRAFGNGATEIRLVPEGSKETVLRPGSLEVRELGGFRCALLDLR